MNSNYGTRLNRNEMKILKGGLEDDGGSCCAHVSAEPGNMVWCCGLTKAQAIAKADELVITYGAEAHWCCKSCIGQSTLNCN